MKINQKSLFILIQLVISVLLVIVVLFCGCGRKSGKIATLILLHWNDFHAMNTPFTSIENGDTLTIGGAANLGGYLNHYRQSAQPTLELCAGDDYQGTPISSITHGRSQVELLNLLQPDAFTVGNHEFDYSVDTLLAGMKAAQFPVLLGNVVWEKDNTLLFPADTIITVDGLKIGVIGVILEGLKSVTTRKATEGLVVHSAEETVRRSLKRLSPLTDIQIALTHLGFEEDSVLAVKIGAELELIVGGHTHTVLDSAKLVNGVYILQAGTKGKYLGIAELGIDTVANRLVTLKSRLELVEAGKYPPDTSIAAVVTRQEASLSDQLDRVIATLQTPWIRSFNSESNVGDFIADAFRTVTAADIGCINSGGLRKDLLAGPVKIRDIYELSPFGNELVRVKLSGNDLQTLALTQAKGGKFLQISGLKYHIRKGEVVSLTVDGQPVESNHIYSLVTVNYVTDHINEYMGFDSTTHPVEMLGLADLDVIMGFVEKKNLIASYIEGRSVIE